MRLQGRRKFQGALRAIMAKKNTEANEETAADAATPAGEATMAAPEVAAEALPPVQTSRKILTRIAPEAYRHPMDQQATASLRSVPGFEFAVSKLSKFGVEQMFYVQFLATAVKVTPKQCGKIHNLLREACAILDAPVPNLFLAQNPVVNAFALGRERPSIVLHTALVEHLDDEELLGVIAHELGHIHCGHTVYRMMWLLLIMASRAGGIRLGVGDVFSLPLQIALYEWARKAEYSADRAAILTTQNPEAVFSTLFKITGGSPKIFEQMDRDEYLKQAEEYDRQDISQLDKIYRSLVEGSMQHPVTVLRSREALRYGESDEYKAILEGRYVRYDTDGRLASAYKAVPVACPNCGKAADPSFSFCIHCGSDLTPAAGGEKDAAVTGNVAATEGVTPDAEKGEADA
jgi:Zn-dependent protease with chaperone function